MLDMDLKCLFFIGTQVIIVATVISGHRHHIKNLNGANQKLEKWLKELQNEVTEIRIKIAKIGD